MGAMRWAAALLCIAAVSPLHHRHLTSPFGKHKHLPSVAPLSNASPEKLVLRKADVDAVDMPYAKFLRGDPLTWFTSVAGREHHRLLSYITSILPSGSVVVDLGTGMGVSALALSGRKTIEAHTFDQGDGIGGIAAMARMDVQKFKQTVPNLFDHAVDIVKMVDNCKSTSVSPIKCNSAAPYEKEAKLILNSSFILLDLGSNPEKQDAIEYKLVSWLMEGKYQGLLMRSNIWIDNNMKRWWSWIKAPKFDVSEVGHSTGTGIIDFGSSFSVEDGVMESLDYDSAPVLPPEKNRVPCVAKSSSNFMLDALEFLPPSGSKQEHGADKDSDDLWREILEMQACGKRETKVDGVWKVYGLGACLHLLIAPFTAAYNQQGAFNLAYGRIGGPSTNAFCPSKQIDECFLQPLHFNSSCKVRSMPQRPFQREFVPGKWGQTRKDKGYFWWVAQAMRYIFRLSPQMQKVVDKIKQKMHFSHPVISMQIRHGDSCVVRSHCFTLQDYMTKAEEMRQRYNVSTIFLATDSYRVIHQSKAYTNFTFLYQRFGRKHFEIPRTLPGKVIDDCHRNGMCDAIEDIKTMVIDLALMSEGDIFIGGFSTNVARIAYELMVARKGCYPPFVSLDVPWCHNNGNSVGTKHLIEKNMNWKDTSC